MATATRRSPATAGSPAGARLARGLALPLLALLLWEVLGRLDVLPEYLVVPSLILLTAGLMAASGELWPHVGASLFRALSGFVLGSAFGILMGLLAGVSRAVGRIYDPLISLAYPVPKVAFLPLIFVWFGIGDLSKIVTLMISVFFPVFINAYYGARSVDRLYVWSARNMGATRLQVFLKVVLPAAMPHILTGLRTGLALSFIVLFAVEMSGAREGLGFLIRQAEDSMRFDLMYVAILMIGLLGFGSDRLLLRLRRRLLAGQTLSREERA